MNYRPYALDDFDQLYSLEELCFKPPFRFSRRMMRALVQHPDSATWIAEQSSRIAGFAIVEWNAHKGETTAYIQTIEVAPDARRQGVAGELLHRMERSAGGAGACSISLHVGAENAGAIRLYESQGYKCSGRKENFYPLGQAALVYTKKLEIASAGGLSIATCVDVKSERKISAGS